MRVLHAVTFDIATGGNLDQLRWELRAVRALGLPWDILMLSKDDPVEPFMHQIPRDCSGLRRRYLFARELLRRRGRYDVLMVRYDINNIFLVWVARRLGVWVSEHHAIEYLEQRVSGSRRGRLLAWAERLVGASLLARCKGVVAVTREILTYQQSRVRQELPGNVVGNGIAVEDVTVAADGRRDVPKIFFVATRFAPWHGLTEVLAAYAASEVPAELHLVGHLGDAYRQAIAVHRRRDHIVVHGFVESQTLPSILAKADVGLSSFNAGATGLTAGSRLKVRHLLAMGIPVIGAEDDAAFPPDFPFYVQVQRPDIDEIVRRAMAWRSHPRAHIRDAATPYIDKTTMMRQMYAWLQQVHRGTGTLRSSGGAA